MKICIVVKRVSVAVLLRPGVNVYDNNRQAVLLLVLYRVAL